MTQMPKPASIKITYFDFHGGRGETARIALFTAGISYEDDRVPGKLWPERKPHTRFGAMPELEVDGKVYTQSNAINRYCGMLAGLYPDDPLQALRCDEVCGAIEQVNAEMLSSFFAKGDEQRRLREAFAQGPLPRYLKGLAQLLDEGGGEWFVDGRLTIADLKVRELTRMLESGQLDHLPKDLVQTTSPTLSQHHQRVMAHPAVKAYYAKFEG